MGSLLLSHAYTRIFKSRAHAIRGANIWRRRRRQTTTAERTRKRRRNNPKAKKKNNFTWRSRVNMVVVCVLRSLICSTVEQCTPTNVIYYSERIMVWRFYTFISYNSLSHIHFPFHSHSHNRTYTRPQMLNTKKWKKGGSGSKQQAATMIYQ